MKQPSVKVVIGMRVKRTGIRRFFPIWNEIAEADIDPANGSFALQISALFRYISDEVAGDSITWVADNVESRRDGKSSRFYREGGKS